MLNLNGKDIQPQSWGAHKKIRNNKPWALPSLTTRFTYVKEMKPQDERMEEIIDFPLLEQPAFSVTKEVAKKKKERKPISIAPTLVSDKEKQMTMDKRERRNTEVYEKQYGSGDEELEDSEDEFNLPLTDSEEPDSSDEEELVEENVKGNPKVVVKMKGEKVKMTDKDKFINKHILVDEAEDDSVEFKRRFDKRHTRRAYMVNAMEEGMDEGMLYTPDEQDKELILMFKGYVNKKTHKLTVQQHNLTPENVKTLLAGKDLTGTDKAGQASTSRNYSTGLKRMLGCLQQELNEFSPGALRDEKIHLAQFFNFNLPDHIQFDNHIMTIEKLEQNLGMRSHMLSAWMQLGKLLLEQLQKLEVKANYQDMSNPDVMDRVKKANLLADQEAARINSKLDIMDKMDKFKHWDGLRKSGAIRVKQYEEQFQQRAGYDPVASIHKFWKSKEVADLIQEMVKMAEDITGGKEIIITTAFIHKMNEIVPILPMLTSGNRPELFANLTRGKFLMALMECANPNKPLNLDPTLSKRQGVQDNTVNGIYRNTNPQEQDPNDPDPPQKQQGWSEGWLQGYVIPCELGKTGYKYTLYIFLSKVSQSVFCLSIC